MLSSSTRLRASTAAVGAQRVADLIQFTHSAAQWTKRLAVAQSPCCNSERLDRPPDRAGHPPGQSQAQSEHRCAAPKGKPSRAPKGCVDELSREADRRGTNR